MIFRSSSLSATPTDLAQDTLLQRVGFGVHDRRPGGVVYRRRERERLGKLTTKACSITFSLQIRPPVPGLFEVCTLLWQCSGELVGFLVQWSKHILDRMVSVAGCISLLGLHVENSPCSSFRWERPCLESETPPATDVSSSVRLASTDFH
jgi:hypothetical protein